MAVSVKKLPDQLQMLDLQLRSALESQNMPKSIAKWDEFLETFVSEGEENAGRK